jgi:UDP-2,3-diacylglucosamine hydrolase
MTMERSRVAYIGDVHLDLGDPALEPFTRMLLDLSETCDALVLMGDLFNLWVGQPQMQLAHQHEVAKTLRTIRRRGVTVHYIEGNRDYRIASAFQGDLFDTAGDDGLELRVGARSVFAIHGDLVNRSDRRYRAWRRFSRSGPFWGCFNLLPASLRLRVAGKLETWMRSTNLAFKAAFPDAMVEEYASGFVSRGYDAIVLGHFHTEKHWDLAGGGSVYVLPEWKGSRRHLVADAEGVRFVDS